MDMFYYCIETIKYMNKEYLLTINEKIMSLHDESQKYILF